MSLLPLDSEPAEKMIFNPDIEDFSIPYDNDNGQQIYTLPALSLRLFPTNVANHIKKHLAHKLYFSRGQKSNYEDDIKEIEKEIEANDKS